MLLYSSVVFIRHSSSLHPWIGTHTVGDGPLHWARGNWKVQKTNLFNQILKALSSRCAGKCANCKTKHVTFLHQITALMFRENHLCGIVTRLLRFVCFLILKENMHSKSKSNQAFILYIPFPVTLTVSSSLCWGCHWLFQNKERLTMRDSLCAQPGLSPCSPFTLNRVLRSVNVRPLKQLFLSLTGSDCTWESGKIGF